MVVQPGLCRTWLKPQRRVFLRQVSYVSQPFSLQVFDGVKRLSSVYIKLYDAGCVLFKTWQASFLCDPEKPVCAILDFGQEVEKIKVCTRYNLIFETNHGDFFKNIRI